MAAFLAGSALGACGDDGGSGGEGAGGRPSIVVTTNILGDVVSSLLGDAAEVTVVMPPGASPHDFQASARDGQAMREADLLVVNGAGFEEGLLDVIESAEADGAAVHEAISAVDVLELAEGGADPHFFTDPARMAVAARGIVDAAVDAVPELDTAAVRDGADAYIAELESLDAEVEAILAVVPEANRVLVTNHEVFGYLADRYGFEVVGTVIPGGSTGTGASAADLAELVQVVEEAGVPAIFADTSSPARLAEALAAEVGDVEVAVLFSESLGEPGSGGETYPAMVRTNAERIAGALS
jgi:zinc/manganese transport system substrate-binding protein